MTSTVFKLTSVFIIIIIIIIIIVIIIKYYYHYYYYLLFTLIMAINRWRNFITQIEHY